MGSPPGDPWWRSGVLYEIYPRSFADSDGDGIGDLGGLIDRLDHLEWLGVDGIWLSPVSPSPNADWGYDVADYCGIDPDYGTLESTNHGCCSLVWLGTRSRRTRMPRRPASATRVSRVSRVP